MLRSREGDEIAVEWEWDGVRGNELGKLKGHRTWAPPEYKPKLLRFAALVSYAESPDFLSSREHVGKMWEGAQYPLLLILVTYDFTKKFRTRRDFKDISFFVYRANEVQDLGSVPAAPWNLEGTRWPIQLA